MHDNASSPAALRLGWGLSALVAVAMIANGGFMIVGQFFAPEALAAMSSAGGFTVNQSVAIGVILLVSSLLYVVPRTAMLGAILLTGFVGGAICTEFRIGTIMSASQLTNVVLGILPWAGLYLRDARVRALLPLRS